MAVVGIMLRLSQQKILNLGAAGSSAFICGREVYGDGWRWVCAEKYLCVAVHSGSQPIRENSELHQ